LIAALLVVGAAVAHAAWNLAMKRAGTSGAVFLTAALALGVVVFAPVGLPALLSSPPAVAWQWWLIVGSGLLQVGYFVLLQRAYRLADVGVVYPLARGTGPLLSVIAAVLVLGERPGPLALLGAALVVAGVIVIGFAGVRGAELDRARLARGVLYGSAVGVIIAGYTLWDAIAVSRVDLDPVGYYWASMVVQLLLLAPIALREGGIRGIAGTVREHPSAVGAVGLLSPLAYVAVLVAYTLAPVSIIAPARELSVVIVAIAAWMLFHEPHPARRLLGSATVLLGIALLAL